MKDTTQQKLRSNLQQLKQILNLFLPQNNQEVVLFFFFLLFYFSYSVLIALNTSIIDNDKFLVDLYFAFDTPVVYQSGYVNKMAHPMMQYFTAPVFYLGNLLEFLSDNYKVKTVFFVFVCCSLISFSIVYVYRYFKNILSLKGCMLYILTFFYAFMSTNLILCFSPESFTISVFLLTFMVYYYSVSIKNKEKPGFGVNMAFALLLGGTTVTNFAKGIVPMLFTENKLKPLIKKVVIIGAVFSFFVLLNFTWENKTGYIRHYNSFNSVSGSFYEHVIDLFWGAPILFPEMITHQIKVSGTYLEGITTEFYHYWWQYMFVVVLFVLTVLGVFKNYKNKLVLLIVSLLGVDLLIHLVAQFGLEDPFIYGGHWVYCVPLLLGWLYSSCGNIYRKILFPVITCMFIFLMVNNVVQLRDFIYLAVEKFPI